LDACYWNILQRPWLRWQASEWLQRLKYPIIYAGYLGI
jgi:hypothetical protein